MYFRIVRQVLEANKIVEPMAKTNFTLGSDMDQLVKDFEEAGFTNIKWWYQPCNFIFYSGEEYFEVQKLFPTNRDLFAKLDEETMAKVKKEAIEACDKLIQNHDPNMQEHIVIIATKK